VYQYGKQCLLELSRWNHRILTHRSN